MGFSEKRAQEVFRVILNWCTVQIPKRDVSIGGKDFVPLQESALRSLSHFIARNRSFLPQSNPILLAAMEDDKSVSSKEKLTLQLRVLCDVQVSSRKVILWFSTSICIQLLSRNIL